MLMNLGIGAKLKLGLGIVLAAFCITVGISIWNLKTMSDTAEAMMQRPLTKERLSSDWYRAIAVGIMRTRAIAKSSDTSLAPFLASKGPPRSGDLQEGIRALLETPEELAHFEKIDTQRKRYLEARDQVNRLKMDGRSEDAMRYLEEQFMPIAETFQELMQELVDLQRNQIDAISSEMANTAQQSMQLMKGLALAAILFAVLVAHFLTRSIVRPLSQAVHVAERVAGGDLTNVVEVQSKDEVGRLMSALGMMNVSLHSLIESIRKSVNEISLASTEIASGNLDLSTRTEQQASAVEETAAATKEIAITIERNVERAERASSSVAAASGVASQSGQAVARVVDTMENINESSKRIASIIGVIDPESVTSQPRSG